MPVYETRDELKAAEAIYRQANAKEAACLATGEPCQCIGNHHDRAHHARGLHLRAPNGLFHSGVRYVALLGCRWCGAAERGHCGGYSVQSRPGIHSYTPPTPAQVRARRIVAGLDPDAESEPAPEPVVPSEPECRCDPGGYDAEPCEADDCKVAFRLEVGIPH
jgi:hypothetical protein